jgi:hypothetical protein
MHLDRDDLLQAAHWWELGGHPTESLTDAWRQVHHALQPAAELGRAFGIPLDDGAQGAFEWIDGKKIIDGYFVGRLIETPRGVVRAALRPFDMALFLIDPGGRIYAELNLADKTIEQAHGWVLTSTMNLFDIPVRQATQTGGGLPDHAVAQGEALSEPNQLALIELVRLYANTASISRAVALHIPEAAPALCWPDPFRLNTRVVLKGEIDAPERYIEVGISPPDSISKSGYWYVAAHDAGSKLEKSSPEGLAKLEQGYWLADGGQSVPMAVLDIDQLHGIEEDTEQRQIVMQFFAQAFNACTRLFKATE